MREAGGGAGSDAGGNERGIAGGVTCHINRDGNCYINHDHGSNDRDAHAGLRCISTTGSAGRDVGHD